MFPPETRNLLLTLQDSNTRPTDFRTKVDSRIRILEEELRVLKRSRNVVASVNRLPTEILALLLSVIVDADDGCDETRMLSLLSVSQVCQHWRDVAIQTTALWSKILFVTPDLTELMLERSGDAPLSITLEGWIYTEYEDVLSRIMKQNRRLRGVQLSRKSEDELARLFSTWSDPLPTLQRLEIDCISMQGLPSNFLASGAPSLQHLVLINVKTFNSNWNLSRLRANLTHLHLSSPSTDAQRPWSSPDFREFLAHAPQLRHLSTTFSLPLPEGTSPPLAPGVALRLPCLEKVLVHDTVAAIELLTRAIEFPSAAKISLTIEPVPASAYQCQLNQIAQNLTVSWKERIHLGVHAIGITQSISYSATFRLYMDPLQAVAPNLILTIMIPIVGSDFPYHEFLAGMAMHWNFLPLRRVSLDGFYTRGITPATWRTFFGPLPNVNRVMFRNYTLFSNFLTSLHPVPADTAALHHAHTVDSPPPIPPFSALKTIKCNDLDIAEIQTRGGNSIADLVEAMEARPSACRSVRIKFSQCQNVTLEHRQRMKACGRMRVAVEDMPKSYTRVVELDFGDAAHHSLFF